MNFIYLFFFRNFTDDNLFFPRSFRMVTRHSWRPSTAAITADSRRGHKLISSVIRLYAPEHGLRGVRQRYFKNSKFVKDLFVIVKFVKVWNLGRNVEKHRWLSTSENSWRLCPRISLVIEQTKWRPRFIFPRVNVTQWIMNKWTEIYWLLSKNFEHYWSLFS